MHQPSHRLPLIWKSVAHPNSIGSSGLEEADGEEAGDGCMVECPLWLGGTTARLHFSCSLSRLSIFMARAIKASWLEGCSVETIWSFMDQRVHGRRGSADKRRSGRCQLPKYRTQWHNQDTLQVSRWSSIKECVDEESQWWGDLQPDEERWTVCV